MLMRPCFNSVWRRRLKFSTLPSLVKPSGSQSPRGACTPSSDSKARNGEAVYMDQSPHALPVSPSWKNIPMIAIIAKRPFAISAFNLRCLTSASVVYKPIGLQPSSPGFLLGSALYPKGPDSQ